MLFGTASLAPTPSVTLLRMLMAAKFPSQSTVPREISGTSGLPHCLCSSLLMQQSMTCGKRPHGDVAVQQCQSCAVRCHVLYC